MRYALAILVLTVLAVSMCAAQESPAPATVSIECKDADIAQALADLSSKAQVSILADSSTRGKVNMSLNNVTVEQALDMMCKSNKLVWTKTFVSTGPDEKPSASKLFALIDALKALGGTTVLVSEPGADKRIMFAPNLEIGDKEVSTVTSQYKLRPIYLVRSADAPKADSAKQPQSSRPATGLAIVAPPSDPKLATNELYTYISQMPPDLRYQVMHDVRHMMYDNMTQAERDAMRQRWDGRRGDGRDRGPRPPGAPQPGMPQPGTPRPGR